MLGIALKLTSILLGGSGGGGVPATALTLGAQLLTLGGETLTLGA
jgi:hypothetical protein